MNGTRDAPSAVLPPDVRKVSDLPRSEVNFSRGYAPNVRQHRLLLRLAGA
jgi:hypothetical protein